MRWDTRDPIYVDWSLTTKCSILKRFCLPEWRHTCLLKSEQISLWNWPSWCLGASWCSRGDDGRDVTSSNSGPGLLCDENCLLVWKRYSVVKGLHHLKNLYSTFILFSSKNSSMFMTEKSSSSNSCRLRCFSQSFGPAIEWKCMGVQTKKSSHRT